MIFVWKCSQVYAKLVNETYWIIKKSIFPTRHRVHAPYTPRGHMSSSEERKWTSVCVITKPWGCFHNPCYVIICHVNSFFHTISGQSRKGEGDNKSKQAGEESLFLWSMCVKRVIFNSSCKRWCGESSVSWQALQTQRRSKAMSKCSAVINSCTGFSHVLIIGSGCSHNVIKWD